MKVLGDILISVQDSDIKDGHFIIPQGINSIAEGAFLSRLPLITITIPQGIASIQKYTFAYCAKLKSVTLPLGLTTIGKNSFYGCTSLTTMTIPQGIISIQEGAFYGCFKLKSVIMPNGLISIDEVAFGDCKSLSLVILSQGITAIHYAAFNNCSNLSIIVIDTLNVEEVQRVKGLLSIKLQNNVLSCDEYTTLQQLKMVCLEELVRTILFANINDNFWSELKAPSFISLLPRELVDLINCNLINLLPTYQNALNELPDVYAPLLRNNKGIIDWVDYAAKFKIALNRYFNSDFASPDLFQAKPSRNGIFADSGTAALTNPLLNTPIRNGSF